jgi:hypothetical protein
MEHRVASPCKVWCVPAGPDGGVQSLGGRVSGVGQEPCSGVSSRLGAPHAGSLTQDYSAIIDLVETLQALPTCDVAEQHNVCFHYTFALNR